MAGKRLLDAAKIFSAGTSIAKQHFVLRRQQWDVYSKTSSLVKAAKSQTDRVTVTAGAAYELAKRFNETTPAWQPTQEQASEPDRAATTWSARDGRDVKSASELGTQTDSQSLRPTVEGSIKDDQIINWGEQRREDTLSSLDKRKLQRQAEGQIPARSADAQAASSSISGRDTFSERTASSSTEFSSLPRTKIPKHPGDGQAGDEHVAEKGLNQDVYYHASTVRATQEDTVPQYAGTGLYTSPRVSKVLGYPGSNVKNPYAGRQKLRPKPLPEMVAAEERRKRELQEHAAAPEPHQQPTETTTQQGEQETQSLAASIANETAMDARTPSETTDVAPSDAPFEMRESRVPASRFGRLWQYGGLATSMAFGAVGESFRRITGGNSEGSLMLSEGNMNRLVAKLSKMRGAALKLGQMISFQDSKVLPPTINTLLQRVQDSADYMPPSQRDQVLVQNLGSDWRDLFSKFEEKPFAAASIGQVHKATLASNGKDVAVKVQYPGVRNSIDSDLNNLSLLLTASRLLPKGLYLDKTIANARTELGWECDYHREAKACMRFKELVSDEPDVFVVPTVYEEASARDVLTAEFMTGTAVTKIPDLTQDDRDWIGTQVLRLALRELMEWRFMQTDPNWTNFLFNRKTRKLELLDFGASRDFPDSFVEPYVSLLIAAFKGDRDSCRDYSIQLGYLTGHESSGMLKAHVDSILTLAEPFVETAPEVYDFRDQTITDRVRANIGLMLRERLAPPPEETYSLHRKLSGAFLLCARLQSKVRARDMFANAVEVWNGRATKVEQPSQG